MDDLAELVAANEDTAAALAAAYETLLGGVPNIAGFTALINSANATGIGAFNTENKFINLVNSLVLGNPTAAANFQAVIAGQASLTDKIVAMYEAFVPAGEQSEAGLAFLTRPEAIALYQAAAAERGVAADVAAFAVILNVLVQQDIGVGDDVNDLLAAIANGTAVLPADGNTFTPIEDADGADFDDDDVAFGTVELTEGVDVVSGTVFNAPRGFTPGGTDQVNTLNDDDELTGTTDADELNFTFVQNADVPTADAVITPTLNDIEEINVAFSTAQPVAILDLQDSTADDAGDTSVNLSRIQLTNLLAGVNNMTYVPDELSINNSNAPSAVVALGFTDKGASGDNDTTKLTLNNVDTAAILLQELVDLTDPNAPIFGDQGIEHITINSVGSSNEVDLIAAEEAQDITITGDQDLRLGQEANIKNGVGTIEAVVYTAGLINVAGSLTSIDASGFTGDLDIALGAETLATLDGKSGTKIDFTVKGGEGDDTFRLTAGVDGAGDTIDGGAGSNTLALYGGNLTLGSFTQIQNLEVRDQAAGGQIKVDTSLLPDLETVTVRNEGNNGVAPAGQVTNVVLNNLTADVAKNITVEHGTTGNNALGSLTVVAKLATDTANDTVVVNIEDGINQDPRFNFSLETAGVENITINDNDTESNTVNLGAGATAVDANGGNLSDITGTLTVTGGQAGQFLNLDASSVGGHLQGIYDLDASGATNDAPHNTDNGGVGNGAMALDAGNFAMDTFSGAKFDGSAYEGDIVVRVDTLRNAAGTAQAGGAQTLLFGKGNDTVVFDFRGDTTAGLTISDTVTGGDGSDTLVIDGEGVKINISASEWTNVSEFEAIRLVGNGVAGTNDVYGKNSYNLTLTNDLIDTNGTAVTGGRTIDIINDNDPFDGVNDLGTGLGGNRGVTIDARSLDAKHNFTYDGADGVVATADRFIMADANINGLAVIDGGVALGGGNAPSNAANADVLEVRNSAVVTTGDLANISNVGTIAFTNDTASVQNSVLQLNDAIVEAMVNTSQTASAGLEETLTITATDNPLVPGAFTQLTVDASQVTSAFLQLNITGGGGIDTITGGAGNDTINGGGGADILSGGAGDDTINGGGGADTISGGDGDDTINGGGGGDTISGGAGDDLINAGTGVNVVTGDAGADTFLFNAGDSFLQNLNNFTIITDFATGTDQLDVVSLGNPVYTEADASAVVPGDFATLVANASAAMAGGGNSDIYVAYNAFNSGDAFVFVDDNADGTYQVTETFIQLTGINLAGEIGAADFI